jgi:hypothetical protein
MRKLLCIIWMVQALLTFAQDISEDDIFSGEEFDKKVKEGIEEEKKMALDLLFGGSFLLRTSWSAPLDFNHYLSQGSLQGKPFLKITDPRRGTLYISYYLSNYFLQAADDPSFITEGDDLLAITFLLSEFYLSFDIAKTVFIKVGNQINSWGASFFWTPVDFINMAHINIEETIDSRMGIPAVKVHIPLSGANLFAIIDFSDTITEELRVRDLSQTINAGLRFDFTSWGAQFGLMAYINAGSASLVNKYGIDFITNVMGFDIYTEQAISFKSSQDADFSKDYYSFAVGFERLFGELKKWSLQSEFFFNENGYEHEKAIDILLQGNFIPFYFGRYYVFVRLQKQDFFTDIMDADLSTIINFSDLSFTVKLSFDFTLPNILPFTFSLSYNGGDQGAEFTLFMKNFITLSIETTFTF